jgi:hypothetical protein
MRMQVLVVVAFCTSIALGQDAPDRPAAGMPAKRGLISTSAGASPGYTLIAPLKSGSTYLIDLEGQPVHEWKSDAPPGNAVYLLENGNLLRTERVDNGTFFGGGQGGRIREFDWDGKLVWEYTGSDATMCLHHDVEVMPNGHVLAIAWERKSHEQSLAAGRDPKQLKDGETWPDFVLEIEPTRPAGGRIVWEWHAWDHLIQDLDATKANHGDVAAHPERIDVNSAHGDFGPGGDRREMDRLKRIGYAGDEPEDRPAPPTNADWLHTNAIDYRADLDAIVVSSHNTNEIWVIDHSTTTAEAATSKGGRYGKGGDLLLRFGNPKAHKNGVEADQQLFGQHDAQWIQSGLAGAGHLLVFNNGVRGKKTSSVDEFALSFDAESLKKGMDLAALKTAKPVWSFTTPRIDSSHISGVQRLPNGDTLICSGESGRLVEVNAKSEVVWEFLSPFSGDLGPMGGPGGPREKRGGMNPPGGRGAGGDDGGPPPDSKGRDPLGRDPLGRGPMGRGPGDENGIFRVDRYAPDYAGLSKRLANTTAPRVDEPKPGSGR